MDISKVIILAAVGEALWETLKMTWQDGKLSADRIGAMIIGLLLSISTGIDIMEVIGVPVKIPYVGVILTGLLISRGANFVHDILSSAGNVNLKTKLEFQNIQNSSTKKS